LNGFVLLAQKTQIKPDHPVRLFIELEHGMNRFANVHRHGFVRGNFKAGFFGKTLAGKGPWRSLVVLAVDLPMEDLIFSDRQRELAAGRFADEMAVFPEYGE